MFQEIEKTFGNNLDLPVKRWNLLDHVNISEAGPKKEFGNHLNQFGVAVGLSMWEGD